MSCLTALFCVTVMLHATYTDAFCERMYKNPYWLPKSLSQRAAEADIVIYGNVVESPCTKPVFVAQNTTTISPTNATNSSSTVQEVTPKTFVNITEGNITEGNMTERNMTNICLMRGLYNVTLNVSCVIKGGSIPHQIHLRSFGFGPEKCVYYNARYNFLESVQSFHVYKGLNYLIFLGRHIVASDSQGFWPHDVNMQYSATEIIDEKYLEPVFQATGGHAHAPAGVKEPDSICTPYIAGAGTYQVNLSLVLLVLLLTCGLLSF